MMAARVTRLKRLCQCPHVQVPEAVVSTHSLDKSEPEPPLNARGHTYDVIDWGVYVPK